LVQSTPAAEVGLSLGNGDGTLQIANLEVTSRPDLRSVILGDFNGDGMVDFAELNPNAGEAMIFLGALPPLLQIAKTHAGNFTQGQIGAQFTITISNAGGSSTAGTVTVTDWSGGNMLITSMSGSGWICVGTSCYRNDVLPVGASYPTITVLANILTLNGGTLPAVINEAFVSGGGALSTASAIDTAQIVQPVPIQYQLTTAVGTGGVAAGSISPASGYFNTGTIVQILATPNAGYSFAGFSGDLTGLTNPQNLTLSSNRSVTANFQVVTLSVPVLAAPASGATGAPISQNLSWNTVTNALSYDIYFGTTNPPPSVTSTSGTIYAPGPLAFGTTYFWRIVARNGSVTASSPVVSFQTVPNGAQPLSVGPASGAAGRQLFTFVARDSVSVNNIQYAQFLFSKSGITALNACYISYDPAANVFYLLSDDMTQWYGLLGGSANTVGNAQCTIYGATSGSVKSGTDLTTSVDISFRSGFAGVKGIYQFAGDMSAGGSGWQSIGTWNDTGDPSAVELISLSPNSGTGVSQIFTAVMKDGDGATTIPFVQFVMNAGLSGFNGCFIHYDRASNVFFLLNDLGTVFSGLVAGSGTVSNSQCTLNGTGSGGTSIGSNLTVTYSLTFSAGFAGTKKIYMQGVDNTGVIEVWHQMGTWTR
jgi:hypothetical protein